MQYQTLRLDIVLTGKTCVHFYPSYIVTVMGVVSSTYLHVFLPVVASFSVQQLLYGATVTLYHRRQVVTVSRNYLQ